MQSNTRPRGCPSICPSLLPNRARASWLARSTRPLASTRMTGTVRESRKAPRLRGDSASTRSAQAAHIPWVTGSSACSGVDSSSEALHQAQIRLMSSSDKPKTEILPPPGVGPRLHQKSSMNRGAPDRGREPGPVDPWLGVWAPEAGRNSALDTVRLTRQDAAVATCRGRPCQAPSKAAGVRFPPVRCPPRRGGGALFRGERAGVWCW